MAPPRSPDGYEPGFLGEARFQPFRLHYFDVGDRQHPTAIIAVRVVEYM
jgi:hypothetical protein